MLHLNIPSIVQNIKAAIELQFVGMADQSDCIEDRVTV